VPADDTGAAKLKEAETSVRLVLGPILRMKILKCLRGYLLISLRVGAPKTATPIPQLHSTF
jgi:hypothetical protein